MEKNRKAILLRRIRTWVALFILGLVVSGVTAIPLRWEVDQAVRVVGVEDGTGAPRQSALAQWLIKIRDGLHDTYAKYPFIAYGTDWLAFGHFVIAIAFFGTYRDPVRNQWLFTCGAIACALVIPFALLVGEMRGIPLFWRFVDCSFGVLGLVPIYFCRRCLKELSSLPSGKA